MILKIASVIIFLFVSGNLFFRAGCSPWIKVVGTGLVLLVSMKYVIYQLMGGTFFSPELPEYFILVMEALYGALIILFFLLVFWDLYLAGNRIMARAGMPVPTHLPSGAIKCGLVLMALALGCWGTYQAVKVPEPQQVRIAVPQLPDALVGLKIAQLSDIHIGPLLKKSWLEEVVQRTNSLNPDIIALTGDFVDGHVSEIGDELQPLASLRAKYGVFGVTGNHEYYWNADEWILALKNLNVLMLNNEHKVLDINGKTLVIAGLPDLVAERFGHEKPDIEKALAGAPAAVRLLLSHQPKNARDYFRLVDLQLSGHTHGGLMFFLQPLIARFNQGFVDGLYASEGKNLYVSPGTGLWNGFSSRIGVPSEITEIILESSTVEEKPGTVANP